MADGSTLLKSRRDWQRFTTSGGFQTELCFTNITSGQIATINGLGMKHRIGVDPDTGNVVSSRNFHISFSEAELLAAPYVTRDDKNELNITGHLVEYSDSTGISRKYKITEPFPDETTGVIYCNLEFYNG
jgi:hypothetical protein